MGQRIQIIVTREDETTKKNIITNIYHNQWLYGANFIRWGSSFTKAFKHLRDQGTPDYRIVKDCVSHANGVNLDYITDTYDYFGHTSSAQEAMEQRTKINNLLEWQEIFDTLDNNNGFMIFHITKTGLSSTIVTGNEDAGINKIVKPIEYLHQFYTTNELIEAGEFDVFESISILDGITAKDLPKLSEIER